MIDSMYSMLVKKMSLPHAHNFFRRLGINAFRDDHDDPLDHDDHLDHDNRLDCDYHLDHNYHRDHDDHLGHNDHLDREDHLEYEHHLDHGDHLICKEVGGCTQARWRLSDLI